MPYTQEELERVIEAMNNVATTISNICRKIMDDLIIITEQFSKEFEEVFEEDLLLKGSNNMDTKDDVVFVTIGVPFSNIPIAQKVMLFVDLGSYETYITVAKKYRKDIADNIEDHGWVKGTKFDPSELYYEIYKNVNNVVPFAMSANAPAIYRA